MTRIFGIAAAEKKDREGETILIDGLDISRLHLLKDEHEHDDFFHKVGSISFSKKIYGEQDCENPKQLRAWQSAKVPLVYIEGEIADDPSLNHQNAQATSAMIKFAARPDVPLDVGLSIDGGILSRKTESGMVSEDGKIIAQSVGLAASVTVKPANPMCKLWLENDLQKSILTAKVPSNILELLKKSHSKHSFHETMDRAHVEVILKLASLKKSLEDYQSAFTDIKCGKCGSGERFFKSSTDVPNACGKCGSSHSMASVWKSLNK